MRTYKEWETHILFFATLSGCHARSGLQWISSKLKWMSSLITHHYQHDSMTSACQMSSLYLKCPDIIVMVLHIASCILYLQHSTPQPPGFVFGGWCHQTAKQRIDPSQAQWHRTVAVGVPTQAPWPWRVPRFDPPGLLYSISASLPFQYIIHIYSWKTLCWKHLWTLVEVPSCPSPCHKSRVACGASHHLSNRWVTWMRPQHAICD